MDKRGKHFRHEVIASYLFIFLVIGGVVVLLSFLNTNFTGFVVYNQNSESEFDLGTYSNTEWNGSAVVLSSGQVSGTYTSKIFDAGAESNWNNLSHLTSTPNVNFLFGVDGGGDVYYSSDLGLTWALKKEDYGRTSDTIEMFSDSDYLYILSTSNKEVWRSGDSGTTWVVVNNSFADSGLLVGEVNSNGNLFAADASGDVYVSSNFGVSWTLLGDFNGGASNNAKGMGIDTSGIIYIVDGSGSVYRSANNGVDWTQQSSGYGGGAGTNDLEIDSSDNLYILFGSDVYESTNLGVNWVKINDDFSPYSNDGCKMFVDSSDNFYIADCSGRVFKSADSGVSWEEKGDLNLGASSDIKGLVEFIQHTNLSFQVRNCSSSDCLDGTWQDVDLSDLDLTGQYFQYKVNFSSPDSSVTSFLESVSVDYDLINTVPAVIIYFPQDGGTYGYNESLSLNYSVIDTDGNVDSCWYNINNGENFSISNCLNTTFDIAEDGSYNLIIYANDSFGLKSSDSVLFDVQIGAPSISLIFPIDAYLNYNENIYFNYTPSDIDLDSCELWGNFNGIYELNQTDNSPVSDTANVFILALEDGNYLWNIRCNDSFGNSVFNGNKTFYVDTINPDLTLIQPSGTKTSRTLTANWNISDSIPMTCKYNVYRGASVEVSNTSVNCTALSTNFAVTVDADFIFNFYANDSAGNSNSSSLTFSVDTSSSSSSSSSGSSGGGSSGGGSSGGGSSGGGSVFSKINVREIPDMIANSGDIKKLNVYVENSQLKFIQGCKVVGMGNYSNWFSSEEVRGLAGGESYEFLVDLKIPENAKSGDYILSLGVVCEGASKNISFNLEVLEKKLEFDLIEVKRVGKDQVRIFYSLKELSGINQNLELQFILFDYYNNQVAEIKQTNEMLSNSKKEFEVFVPVDESLSGELSLLVNMNSETYSGFIQESVILGAPTTGFVLFGRTQGFDTTISIVIAIFFLIFAVFIIVRIIKYKKKINKK